MNIRYETSRQGIKKEKLFLIGCSGVSRAYLSSVSLTKL
jgi:hypothetical protein